MERSDGRVEWPSHTSWRGLPPADEPELLNTLNLKSSLWSETGYAQDFYRENEGPTGYGATVINGLSDARVLSPMPDTFLRSSTVLNGPCSWRYWVMALALVGPIPFRDVSWASSAVLMLMRAGLPGTVPIPALPCSTAVPAFPGIELVPGMPCAKTMPAAIRCTAIVTTTSHCILRCIRVLLCLVSRKAKCLTCETLDMYPSCHHSGSSQPLRQGHRCMPFPKGRVNDSA